MRPYTILPPPRRFTVLCEEGILAKPILGISGSNLGQSLSPRESYRNTIFSFHCAERKAPLRVRSPRSNRCVKKKGKERRSNYFIINYRALASKRLAASSSQTVFVQFFHQSHSPNSSFYQKAKSSHKGKIHALDSKSFLFRVDQYSTSDRKSVV